MSKKIIQLNEEIIKGQIKEFVHGSVEETLDDSFSHLLLFKESRVRFR